MTLWKTDMASPLQDLIKQIQDLATDVGNLFQLRGFKVGGTAGQVPVKTDGTDFNWSWGDAAASVTVDSTIIDGSTNAVSGNAVFDALAAKAPSTGIAPSAITGTAVVTADATETPTASKLAKRDSNGKLFAKGLIMHNAGGLTTGIIPQESVAGENVTLPGAGSAQFIALTRDPTGLTNLTNSVTGELPPANLAGGATGKSLLAAETNGAAWTALGIVSKKRTSDSAAIVSSTSMVADSTIAGFTLKANTSYRVDFCLFVSCGAGGWAGRLSLPSYSGSAGHSCGDQHGYTPASLTMGTNIIAFAARTTTTTGAICAGYAVFRTIAGGTMDLQWAQNSSNASDTKLLDGSTVRVTEL
jgi:hypothetical protein